MTSRPARRSLASAFRPEPSPTSRADALSGLLPPRLSKTEDSAALTGGAAAVPATGNAHPASPRLVPSAPSAGLELADADADRVRNVAVYLPVELLERLRRTTRSREITYADLLVEAASAHLDEVGSALAPVSSRAAGTGMPSRTRRAPRPGVQVQIRLDGHQVTWLDNQVARLGAPSRTALVVALLNLHLDARGSSTAR